MITHPPRTQPFRPHLPTVPRNEGQPAFRPDQDLADAYEGPKAKQAGLQEAQNQVAQNDARARELQQKLTRLVDQRFGGDPERAFNHYDRNNDNRLSRSEIRQALADAGVGNRFTRGLWVDGILKQLDSNRNGALDRSEFLSVLRQGG